ncbi:sensor histidine kinase [Telluribacter sp.]|jgi:signal transduction histidine kinase|uniref:sensor histidine kinase n=1 Tax=Telluribacter sp. TaxID=1978767 RepID=UPI002E0F96FD|nr:ATP-binding protein [Telluribacter sp.]
MTNLKKIFHSFGINDLLNASTSGLLLFKKEKGAGGVGEQIVCTVDNASAQRLTGKTTLTGKTWENITGLEVSTLPTKIENSDTEVFFSKSDTWCRVSNVPIDEYHFLCTLSDITTRKGLENRFGLNHRLLKEAELTMRFGSWTWDLSRGEQGAIEWTDGTYSLFGYSSKDFTSVINYEFFLKHVHPDDLEIVDTAIKSAIQQGETFVVEYRIITVTGEEKNVVSRGQLVSDELENKLIYLGSIFDITSLKVIQNELERRVEDLNKSNEDLEQFAYVASHDLQEPLRKIVSFGERLESRSRGALNEEQRLYLDRILNATRRMQEMISNLLEFSRVARTKEGFLPTDLNTVLKSTLSDLEITIQQKNALVMIGDLPEIEGIPSQMSQLFMNLLSNALKFSKREVRPIIKIESEFLKNSEVIRQGLVPDRGYVRLTVSDNGIGFENEQSGRIFTLFQRLRGRSEFEGAGIGLSVCKKVVENHCGTIEAKGVPDGGATFIIVLPISQS